MKATPQVTAQQARATANLFLSDRLPDRFSADFAPEHPSKDIWRVPVILSYPFIGSLGEVGEILVSAISGEIVDSTSSEDMKQAGQRLYEAHRDEIEAAFL